VVEEYHQVVRGGKQRQVKVETTPGRTIFQGGTEYQMSKSTDSAGELPLIQQEI